MTAGTQMGEVGTLAGVQNLGWVLPGTIAQLGHGEHRSAGRQQVGTWGSVSGHGRFVNAVTISTSHSPYPTGWRRG